MSNNIESILKNQAGDWHRSRKIRLGDKWLVVFWRGAVIVDEEPIVDLPHTNEDQLRFVKMWAIRNSAWDSQLAICNGGFI
jgi:hypothetical protein